MTTEVPKTKVVAALVIGAIAISFAAIFFRLAAPTHPIVAPGIRLLIAGGLLTPWIMYQVSRGRVKRRWVITGLFGGVLYAFHFGLWVSSLFFTTVAASVTLVTATPLLLGVYGVLTNRDKPTNRLWVSIAISGVGVALIAGSDLFTASLSAVLGDLMALGGAASIAFYFLLTREIKAVDVFVMTGLSSLVGGTLLIASAYISGVDMTVPDHAWIYLFAAAAVPQLIGHTSLFWALRFATPTQVGFATLGEPVAAGLLAWVILAEVPTVGTIVGSAIVLVGIFYSFERT